MHTEQIPRSIRSFIIIAGLSSLVWLYAWGLLNFPIETIIFSSVSFFFLIWLVIYFAMED